MAGSRVAILVAAKRSTRSICSIATGCNVLNDPVLGGNFPFSLFCAIHAAGEVYQWMTSSYAETMAWVVHELHFSWIEQLNESGRNLIVRRPHMVLLKASRSGMNGNVFIGRQFSRASGLASIGRLTIRSLIEFPGLVPYDSSHAATRRITETSAKFD